MPAFSMLPPQPRVARRKKRTAVVIEPVGSAGVDVTRKRGKTDARSDQPPSRKNRLMHVASSPGKTPAFSRKPAGPPPDVNRRGLTGKAKHSLYPTSGQPGARARFRPHSAAPDYLLADPKRQCTGRQIVAQQSEHMYPSVSNGAAHEARLLRCLAPSPKKTHDVTRPATHRGSRRNVIHARLPAFPAFLEGPTV